MKPVKLQGKGFNALACKAIESNGSYPDRSQSTRGNKIDNGAKKLVLISKGLCGSAPNTSISNSKID